MDARRRHFPDQRGEFLRSQQYWGIESILSDNDCARFDPGMGAYAEFAADFSSGADSPGVLESNRGGWRRDHRWVDGFFVSSGLVSARSRPAQYFECCGGSQFAPAQLCFDQRLLWVGL